MKINYILDKFLSNLLIYVSYTLIVLLWSYCFYNFGNDINLLLFYFPFGIIILAFLFFGNRIIIALLLSYFSLFFVLKNYNLHLPFNDFFVMSASQLICVPLTLFVLQKFNVTIGVGKNYKINKTDIFHVLLLTFCSTIMLGTIIFFSSLFFNNQTALLNFTTGNLLGGGILIVSMKILVNVPNLITSLIKK
mgnify:CR=1 FL=1